MNLRTPIPTLEPDDAFVARLSALAAAGAPVAASPRSPIATWRVAFAAAGVAAILVGVAWLAGLSPTGSPQPAPGPATSPSAPESPDASDATTPGASTTRTDSDEVVDSPLFGAAPPASATATHTPASPARSQEPGKEPGKDQGQAEGQGQQGQGQAQQGQGQQGQGQGQQGQQTPPRGPNAHAGDHPNEHATTKSNNGNPAPPGPKPDRGPRSQAQQR